MDEDDLTFDTGINQNGLPKTQFANKSTFTPEERNHLNQKFYELSANI